MPAPLLPLLAMTAALATAADESPLRVTEAEICREVVQRECRGLDRTVASDVETVAFMTRVEGATGEAFVTHVWSFEGAEVRRVRLAVKAANYRTWSMKRVKNSPGKWKAEVLDPVGRVLGSLTFVVQPPAGG